MDKKQLAITSVSTTYGVVGKPLYRTCPHHAVIALCWKCAYTLPDKGDASSIFRSLSELIVKNLSVGAEDIITHAHNQVFWGRDVSWEGVNARRVAKSFLTAARNYQSERGQDDLIEGIQIACAQYLKETSFFRFRKAKHESKNVLFIVKSDPTGIAENGRNLIARSLADMGCAVRAENRGPITQDLNATDKGVDNVVLIHVDHIDNAPTITIQPYLVSWDGDTPTATRVGDCAIIDFALIVKGSNVYHYGRMALIHTAAQALGVHVNAIIGERW